MCGFAGAVVWDERYRVSPQTLTKMSAAVAHRGPDGQGFHHTRLDTPIDPANPQVALAFRRLAILDPDPRSDQPFTVGAKTLVFNGEIYNFRDLRQELAELLPDWPWRTTGDTEVLLAAYTAWGEQCVEKLNGMFALAVWDEAEKTLFLARDRMGQKPLYWAARTSDGNRWTGMRDASDSAMKSPFAAIAFASELSALMNLPWISRELDLEGLNAYLRLGYIPVGRTCFAEVQKLSYACCATARHGSPRARHYFDPLGARSSPVSTEAAIARTRALVEQAVRRQIVSDVPIGCLLSGGIDSSVVAAAMGRAARAPSDVTTFSLKFDDPRYDESGFAQAVSEHLGIRHHRLSISPDAAADLPKLAEVFGEPFGDSSALPTHLLAQQVRSFVKVVLGGDGGDELFGGYDRYRGFRVSAAFDRVPRVVRRLAASAGRRVLSGRHPKSRASKLKRFLDAAPNEPVDRYLAYLSIFSPDQIASLLAGDRPHAFTFVEARVPAAMWNQWYLRRGPVRTAMAIDRSVYLPDDLLTKIDRASMLHALEVRSPFMDHELVTFAAGLTSDQLLEGGPKRMLREAFAADLPAWVFERKKMGFAVPIGEWFRGPLREMLRETLFSSHAFGRSHFNMKVVERLVEEHESQRVDHSQRLYALLMLELWWNTVRV